MLAISRSRALLCAAAGVAVAIAIVIGSGRKESGPQTTESEIASSGPSELESFRPSTAQQPPRRLPKGHGDSLTMIRRTRSQKSNSRDASRLQNANDHSVLEREFIQLAALEEPAEDMSDDSKLEEEDSSPRRIQRLPPLSTRRKPLRVAVAWKSWSKVIASASARRTFTRSPTTKKTPPLRLNRCRTRGRLPRAGLPARKW